MFKEQNINALIGILWGLAVYFNLHSLDPNTLNVFAIWAVSINSVGARRKRSRLIFF
jgi:phage shock protein PspC (stress-responsive transcriptional regulator)